MSPQRGRSRVGSRSASTCEPERNTKTLRLAGLRSDTQARFPMTERFTDCQRLCLRRSSEGGGRRNRRAATHIIRSARPSSKCKDRQLCPSLAKWHKKRTPNFQRGLCCRGLDSRQRRYNRSLSDFRPKDKAQCWRFFRST